MPLPPLPTTTPPQNSTALDIIKSSFRLINVLASGENPEPEDALDALKILNDMISSWNIEESMIYTLGNYQEFPLTVGKQDYTLGPGGDFDAPRPDHIQRMGIVSLGNAAQPLELPCEILTTEEWAEVPVKLITSTLPLQCYDDGGFPFRGLHFRYIPQVAVKVRIYAWNALPLFPDLVTPASLPPGYLKAIRYNLAVDLAAEFAVQLRPEVALIALSSKAAIKSINSSPIDLKCDPGVVGTHQSRVFNWITGESK